MTHRRHFDQNPCSSSIDNYLTTSFVFCSSPVDFERRSTVICFIRCRRFAKSR